MILLALCLAFLGLYLITSKIPRKRIYLHSRLMVGVELGLVAGNGPYGVLGITPIRPAAKPVLHLRGIGYVIRLDREQLADGNTATYWFVRIPYWWFAVLFALLYILSLRKHVRMARRQDRLRRGLCPACGYDLRASKEKCPECGTAIAQLTPGS